MSWMMIFCYSILERQNVKFGRPIHELQCLNESTAEEKSFYSFIHSDNNVIIP